eukprot:5473776-Pyramimonas_sp.AAC.1
MSCGPHKKGTPARDFLAIHAQKRLPPETSAAIKLQNARSDCNPMIRSDYQHELRAPQAKGSRLRCPCKSFTDGAPA